MLSIEHIIDPVPPADLDRIDLMYVKMYVRNKIAVVSHPSSSFMVWRIASASLFFSRISSF